MLPFSTDTIPVGISHTTSSSGHSTATDFTSSLIGSRPRPGLHEVPVAEQHRVGHRAEEQRAHLEAGEAQRVVAADERRPRRPARPPRRSVRGGRAGGRTPSAASSVAVGASSESCRSSPRRVRRARASLLALAAHAGAAADVRLEQRDARGDRHHRRADVPDSRAGAGVTRDPRSRRGSPARRTRSAAASRSRCPTSRRRVVTQQNSRPPVAHCTSTVARSSCIARSLSRRSRGRAARG